MVQRNGGGGRGAWDFAGFGLPSDLVIFNFSIPHFLSEKPSRSKGFSAQSTELPMATSRPEITNANLHTTENIRLLEGQVEQ